MVHLVKLCVGIDSVAHLAERLAWRTKNTPPGEAALFHDTRMFPKRADELLEGGSLYWVIKGVIQARQSIDGLDRVQDREGIQYCRIILGPDLMLTQSQPRRAFQGWRYLADDDVPADIGLFDPNSDDLPEDMRADLIKLGLL